MPTRLFDSYSDVIPTRDAVALTIQGWMAAGGWPANLPKPTVLAVYDIYSGLADLTGGRVLCVPSKRTDEHLSRANTDASEVTIDVCIQFKYGQPGPTLAQCDPYMALAEYLARLMKSETLALSNDPTLPTLPEGSSFVKLEWPQLFYQKHMEDFRVFTTVFAASFMVPESPAQTP